MEYLDPERPRLHTDEGLPLFTGLPRRVVLPGLHIAPRQQDGLPVMEISVFLPLASGGASRRDITLPPDQFLAFWAEWLADPERTARERFNWDYGTPAPTPGKPSGPAIFTFEDLF
jgi:hypothetical protein